MKLTSSAFKHEGDIPSEYTCDGSNINPPFEITHVPTGTQSLVFIMDDPDVPKHLREDGMFDHWVIFNIPPTITVIEKGKQPPGTPGIGTGQSLKYYGPCPPDGKHRYFFKLYALDTLLSLQEKATKKQIEKAMEGHILGKTELMGVYKRI